MTSATPPIDSALIRLGDRICEAAGTDLRTVLDDLTSGSGGSCTPPAIRSGWQVSDTALPTPDGTVAP